MDLYAACRTPRTHERQQHGVTSAESGGRPTAGSQDAARGRAWRPWNPPRLVLFGLVFSILLLVFALIGTWQVH